MTCKEISHQKACAIVKKYSDCRFDSLKTYHECLLRTGAKVLKYENKYYLSGYAMSGEDTKML